MVSYVPAACRPPVRPRPGPHGHKSLGLTFENYFGWSAAVGDGVRLLFHGATTYLGFRVWSRETGFISILGLVLGIGQAIGAVCDVVSLAQRAAGTHPPEPRA